MSGTKMTCFIMCALQCTCLFAVAWNTTETIISAKENNPLTYSISPVLYPDTFCVATSWTPVYHGFNVHEGMVYLGWSNADVSLKSQIHPLMSNHELSVGFKILDQEQIEAGLQFHYSCSFLYGQDTKHEGSVSGAVSVHPSYLCDVTFYSFRILSFPHESTRTLFESQSGAQLSYDIFSSLIASLALEKRDGLPWELVLGISYSIIPSISFLISYQIQSEELVFGASASVHRWQVLCHICRHEYLGFNEHLVIAYNY